MKIFTTTFAFAVIYLLVFLSCYVSADEPPEEDGAILVDRFILQLFKVVRSFDHWVSKRIQGMIKRVERADWNKSLWECEQTPNCKVGNEHDKREHFESFQSIYTCSTCDTTKSKNCEMLRDMVGFCIKEGF